MAFLGTIGTINESFVQILYTPSSTVFKESSIETILKFNNSWQPLSDFGNNFGSISGIIMKQGRLVSRPVYLYLRDTGELVRTILSDYQGNFSFTNIDKRLEYFVVAVDENISIEYNATIVDKIIPT